LRAACLTAAARAFRNPDGLQAESVGAYSVTFGRTDAAGGVLLDDTERALVRRYRP
jgi:hypothetical protein